jgi:hypothetical protein
MNPHPLYGSSLTGANRPSLMFLLSTLEILCRILVHLENRIFYFRYIIISVILNNRELMQIYLDINYSFYFNESLIRSKPQEAEVT